VAPGSERSAAAVPAVDAEVGLLQAKLKRKVVEFRNLFEVSQALNLARDLDDAMGLFGRSVMGQFRMDRLVIFLTDNERGERLVPKHVRGFDTNEFRGFQIPSSLVREHGPDAPLFALDGLGVGQEGEDGIEALRQIGFDLGMTLWARQELEGVLFLGGRGDANPMEEETRDLLTILGHQGAVAIANARFHRAQEERNLGLVRGMVGLLESADDHAKGSTERVVRYVTALGRDLKFRKDRLRSLIYGAVLRDLGMITVSGLILKNPAHLSDEEWSVIRQHPVRGAQILEEMNFSEDVVEIVRDHHERWGGEGYPRGIRGTEIPLGARIVSLVDAYVAMTSERPYRRALPYEKARQVIAENWGSPFDPTAVEAFLAVLDKLERRTRVRTGQLLLAESDA
jgi:hypothetical protein